MIVTIIGGTRCRIS